jgi:hypothetical protein
MRPLTTTQTLPIVIRWILPRSIRRQSGFLKRKAEALKICDQLLFDIHHIVFGLLSRKSFIGSKLRAALLTR